MRRNPVMKHLPTTPVTQMTSARQLVKPYAVGAGVRSLAGDPSALERGGGALFDAGLNAAFDSSGRNIAGGVNTNRLPDMRDVQRNWRTNRLTLTDRRRLQLHNVTNNLHLFRTNQVQDFPQMKTPGYVPPNTKLSDYAKWALEQQRLKQGK